jgi:hypothetical protein
MTNPEIGVWASESGTYVYIKTADDKIYFDYQIKVTSEGLIIDAVNKEVTSDGSSTKEVLESICAFEHAEYFPDPEED